MNRVTVRRLLYIQCEQNRSHDEIDIEGHIGVCEKKRKQNLVILVVLLLFFILVIPARFLVRGKKNLNIIAMEDKNIREKRPGLFFHLEFGFFRRPTFIFFPVKRNMPHLQV